MKGKVSKQLIYRLPLLASIAGDHDLQLAVTPPAALRKTWRHGQHMTLTHEDENPSPTAVVANAIHLVDGEGEETAEGTGGGGGAEEDTGSESEFAALIPPANEVIASGK